MTIALTQGSCVGCTSDNSNIETIKVTAIDSTSAASAVLLDVTLVGFVDLHELYRAPEGCSERRVGDFQPGLTAHQHSHVQRRPLGRVHQHVLQQWRISRVFLATTLLDVSIRPVPKKSAELRVASVLQMRRGRVTHEGVEECSFSNPKCGGPFGGLSRSPEPPRTAS